MTTELDINSYQALISISEFDLRMSILFIEKGLQNGTTDWVSLIRKGSEEDFTQIVDYLTCICPREVLTKDLLEYCMDNALRFYNKKLVQLLMYLGCDNWFKYQKVLIGPIWTRTDDYIFNEGMDKANKLLNISGNECILWMINSFVSYRNIDDKTFAGFCTSKDLPMQYDSLGAAIRGENYDLMEFLYKHKPDKMCSCFGDIVSTRNRELIDRFIVPGYENMHGYNNVYRVMKAALKTGDIELVEYLYSKSSGSFDSKNFLLEAVKMGQVDLIRFCLDNFCTIIDDEFEEALIRGDDRIIAMFKEYFEPDDINYLNAAIKGGNITDINRYMDWDDHWMWKDSCCIAIDNNIFVSLEYLINRKISFGDSSGIREILSYCINREGTSRMFKFFSSLGFYPSSEDFRDTIGSHDTAKKSLFLNQKWRSEWDHIFEDDCEEEIRCSIYFNLFLGADNWDLYIKYSQMFNKPHLVKFFQRCKQGLINPRNLYDQRE